MFYDETIKIAELSTEEKIALLRDDIDEYRRDCLLESCFDVFALSMTDKMSYGIELFKAYLLLAEISDDPEMVLDFFKEPLAQIIKRSVYFRVRVKEIIEEREDLLYIILKYYATNVDPHEETSIRKLKLSAWDQVTFWTSSTAGVFLLLLFMAVVTYHVNMDKVNVICFGGSGLTYMIISSLVAVAFLFAMFGFRRYHVKRKIATYYDTIFD